uniref:Thrombomodulin n=1 Tax=Stegastes partitus TaxID=144197 RepID=A0A3B5AVN0_9TELE
MQQVKNHKIALNYITGGNDPGSIRPLEQYHNYGRTLGGAQITYTTFSGLAVADSDAFPAGTTAVKRDADGEPPASKYLCSSANWLPAPWPCEVLNGGCEFNCSSETQTCTCPEGQILHPNNISCTKQPCADGAQGCLQVGAIHAPECPKGFRLAQDGKSCEDINECEEDDPCTAEGEECENTSGGFMCICQEDFVFEDGMCVNITICGLCEQMICPKIDGNMQQCFCPDGYITDIGEGTIMCEHKCENLFGGYRCLCNESFKLQDGYKCVPLYEPDEGGSGSTESFFTPASRPASGHSAPLPSYIKTGSILGITLFLLLCLGLLCFLIRNAFRPECDPNDSSQCYCPAGYVAEERGRDTFCIDMDECSSYFCDQDCKNTFGGYVCMCSSGYTLVDGYKCVKNDDEDGDGGVEGSGMTTAPNVPTTLFVPFPGPTKKPSGVTVGGLVGIIVCTVLFIVLLVFLVNYIFSRRGKMQSNGALKAPEGEAHGLHRVSSDGS